MPIQRDDDALAGQEKKDIPRHPFLPDPNNDKTIRSRGKYIEIVNKETDDQKTVKENIATDTNYNVPARYTYYIKGGGRCRDYDQETQYPRLSVRDITLEVFKL